MITDWMDQLNTRWSELTGIPASELSTHLGGEAFGVLAEIVAGWTTKGWLNKLVQGAAGAIATGYGLLGKDVDTRLRRELLQFGAHEMSRALPMNPEELEQLRRSFGELIGLAKAGKMSAALATGLRTPVELSRAFGSSPVRRTVVRSPTAPPSPAPASSSPAQSSEGTAYPIEV